MAKPPTKAQIQAENDVLKKKLAEAESAAKDLEDTLEEMSSTQEWDSKKRTEMDRAHRETMSDLEKMTANFHELKRELADTKKALEHSEEEIDQMNQVFAGFTGDGSAQLPGKMKAYTKYSYFVEKKMGLGRNGKRLLHGGATAGATYGVGKYLETGVIVDNPLTSMAVAAGVGVISTVVLDATVMDKKEMLKMRLAELGEMTQSEQKDLVQAAVAAKIAS